MAEFKKEVLISTPISTADGLIIGPNNSIGLHHHVETEETYVVMKGSGWLYRNKRRKAVKAGDFLTILSGVKHSLKNGAEESMVVLAIKFTATKGYPLKENDIVWTPSQG